MGMIFSGNKTTTNIRKAMLTSRSCMEAPVLEEDLQIKLGDLNLTFRPDQS